MKKHYKNYYLALFAALIVVSMLIGCEEKRKALVSAHAAMGELLASTKDRAKLLHTRKMIDDQTYQSIRTNWIRAQTSYLKASDMLEHILSTDAQDITAYTELITQVSTILSDVALWMEEDKHEPTVDHIVSNPTPTPDYAVSSRDTANPGVERVGSGDFEKNRAGDEGQSSVSNVGKLKIVSVSESVYNARDVITIHGITEKTAEVRVWVTIGSIVYTLDSSEPVLTDGVSGIAISQCITLDAAQARQFAAKAGMSGTRMHVMIMETL